MIPRYARKEAAAIWSAETRFKIMFEILAHAADAQAELGVIPKEAARVIWEKGRDTLWDADRIDVTLESFEAGRIVAVPLIELRI